MQRENREQPVYDRCSEIGSAHFDAFIMLRQQLPDGLLADVWKYSIQALCSKSMSFLQSLEAHSRI